MYAPYCYFWSSAPYAPTSYTPLPLPNFHPPCKTEWTQAAVEGQKGVKEVEGGVQTVKMQQGQVKREYKSKQSRFKYPKKNVQSNVVNQIISFLSTKAKSHKVLKKILLCPLKIEAFYLVLKEVKKLNKQYIGRNFLQGLFEMEVDHPVHQILFKRVPMGLLSFEQMREGISKLTNYFLRNLIVPTLLTSSKLDKSTLQQHLQRAREILSFVRLPPAPLAN